MNSRRDFLKWSSALLATSAFPWAQAYAEQEARKKYLVFIYLSEGLDVTLGLDPWIANTQGEALPTEREMFVEYRQEDLLRANNEMFLGPTMQPLMKYKDRLSVLNGIFVNESDNGHEAALMAMETGAGSGQVGSLPAVFQARFSHGGLGVGTNASIHLGSEAVVPVSLSTLTGSSTTRPAYLGLNANVLNSQTAAGQAMLNLLSNRQNFENARTQIASVNTASNSGDQDTPAEAARKLGSATAIAMKNSLFKSARLELDANGIDSHSNHPGTHKTSQQGMYEQVSSILDAFAAVQSATPGRSMLDETQFIVLSEFSRTPGLNGARGKDHNPQTNSIIVIGDAFQSGKVVGGSQHIASTISAARVSQHVALPYNFAASKAVSSLPGRAMNLASTLPYQAGMNVDYITPEVVIKTIAKGMGITEFGFLGSNAASVPTIDALLRT